jgi:AcrR family transcriptional regulator
MGNREDLIAGAKRCLLEKGYRATTARDIAAAAGVSLAAIGYHFGSKEELMNQAVYQAVGEWAETFEGLPAVADPQASALERFEALWTHVIESFAQNRPLWAAQFELVAEMDHRPQLREFFAAIQPEAHAGLGELFHGTGLELDEKSRLLVGTLYHALLLGVMAQWFIDPKSALSGRDVIEALRVAASVVKPDTGG